MNQRARWIVLFLALVLMGGLTVAGDYDVTITNLTKGQTFTPLLVVSHMPSIQLFEPGTAASFELEAIAEGGNIGPMADLLAGVPQVRETNTNGALLAPGETATIRIRANGRFDRISLAGMLIPTNDTFVGMRSLRIPTGAGPAVAYVPAYDAGTELNDQSCAHMPGPRCPGGEGMSPPAKTDEGFIYIGNGFHELGSGDPEGPEILGPLDYDWRNPVARVEIRRAWDGDDEGGDDESGDD